ncbi:hypothetical protein WDU94_013209 [Cyamophila willieti]
MTPFCLFVVLVFCFVHQTNEEYQQGFQNQKKEGTFIRDVQNLQCSKRSSSAQDDSEWTRNAASVPYSKEDDVLLENSANEGYSNTDVNVPYRKGENVQSMDSLNENGASIPSVKNTNDVRTADNSDRTLKKNSANVPYFKTDNELAAISANHPYSSDSFQRDAENILNDKDEAECSCGAQCSCPKGCSCRQKKSVLTTSNEQQVPSLMNRLVMGSEPSNLGLADKDNSPQGSPGNLDGLCSPQSSANSPSSYAEKLKDDCNKYSLVESENLIRRPQSETLTLSDTSDIIAGDQSEALTASDTSGKTAGDQSEALTASDTSGIIAGDQSEALTASDTSGIIAGDQSEALTASDTSGIIAGDQSEALTASDTSVKTARDQSEALTASDTSGKTAGDQSEALTASDTSGKTAGDQSEALTASDTSGKTAGDQSEALTASDTSGIIAGDQSEALTASDTSGIIAGDQSEALTASDTSGIIAGDQSEALTASDTSGKTAGDQSEALTASDTSGKTVGDQSEALTASDTSGKTAGDQSEALTASDTSDIIAGDQSEALTAGDTSDIIAGDQSEALTADGTLGKTAGDQSEALTADGTLGKTAGDQSEALTADGTLGKTAGDQSEALIGDDSSGLIAVQPKEELPKQFVGFSSESDDNTLSVKDTFESLDALSVKKEISPTDNGEAFKENLLIPTDKDSSGTIPEVFVTSKTNLEKLKNYHSIIEKENVVQSGMSDSKLVENNNDEISNTINIESPKKETTENMMDFVNDSKNSLASENVIIMDHTNDEVNESENKVDSENIDVDVNTGGNEKNSAQRNANDDNTRSSDSTNPDSNIFIRDVQNIPSFSNNQVDVPYSEEDKELLTFPADVTYSREDTRLVKHVDGENKEGDTKMKSQYKRDTQYNGFLECQCGVSCSCPKTCSCRQKKSILHPTRVQSVPSLINKLAMRSESQYLNLPVKDTGPSQVCPGSLGENCPPAKCTSPCCPTPCGRPTCPTQPPPCCTVDGLVETVGDKNENCEITNDHQSLAQDRKSYQRNTQLSADQKIEGANNEESLITNEHEPLSQDENTGVLYQNKAKVSPDQNLEELKDSNKNPVLPDNQNPRLFLSNDMTDMTQLTADQSSLASNNNEELVSQYNTGESSVKNPHVSDDQNIGDSLDSGAESSMPIQNVRLTLDKRLSVDQNKKLSGNNADQPTNQNVDNSFEKSTSFSSGNSESVKDTLEFLDAFTVKKDTLLTNNGKILQINPESPKMYPRDMFGTGPVTNEDIANAVYKNVKENLNPLNGDYNAENSENLVCTNLQDIEKLESRNNVIF